MSASVLYQIPDGWALEVHGLRWISPYRHELEIQAALLGTGDWLSNLLAERIDRPGAPLSYAEVRFPGLSSFRNSAGPHNTNRPGEA